MRRRNRISLSDAAEMNREEMAINEIDARAEDKTWKSGLLLGQMDVLLSLYLLGYTAFGLLDTVLLRRVAHP